MRLEACLMFATFCFQHMSLHIQAPRKDPDYEGMTLTWASLLLPQRSWWLHSWPLTHLKKLHSWCVQLLSEKYIFQKSYTSNVVYVLLNLQGDFLTGLATALHTLSAWWCHHGNKITGLFFFLLLVKTFKLKLKGVMQLLDIPSFCVELPHP